MTVEVRKSGVRERIGHVYELRALQRIGHIHELDVRREHGRKVKAEG